MNEIDKYYQILGLNPGTPEEEIKQAYKDLVKVWHPDRFSDPRLKEKANEKLKEINIAYQKLKSYIAANSRQYASSEGDYARSQPPPHEPPPKWEKEQSSTKESGGHGESEPPPNEPPLDASEAGGIWNPNATANWSLPFTPAFGSYLQMLNWRTLGEPPKASSAQSWFYASLLMQFINFLMWVFMSDPKVAAMAIWWVSFLYLITWYFAANRPQAKYVKTKFGTNYPKKPWGQALLIAVGCWVAAFALGFILRAVTTEDNIHTASVPPSSAPTGGGSTESPETGLTAMDWYNKGQSLQHSGNYKEAIDAYSRAIGLNAQFAVGYVNRGFAYYNLGDFEQAITDCGKAIELNPTDAMAYYYRGWAFLEKQPRHLDEALEDFNKANYLNPNVAAGYVGRGWAFLRKHRFDEAFGDFNKAISIDPNDPAGAGHNGRGFAFYKEGQYDNAVEDFNRAIRINPNHPSIYYNRGYAYLALGKDRLAITDLQKSIELNKNIKDFRMRDCYIGLSIACFRQNRIEDAKANYLKAIEVEPLCKNGLDAVEKRDDFSYTPGNKQTVNEILKLF